MKRLNKSDLAYLRKINAYACVRYFFHGNQKIKCVFSRSSLFCFLSTLTDFGFIDFEVSFNPYYKQN